MSDLDSENVVAGPAREPVEVVIRVKWPKGKPRFTRDPATGAKVYTPEFDRVLQEAFFGVAKKHARRNRFLKLRLQAKCLFLQLRLSILGLRRKLLGLRAKLAFDGHDVRSLGSVDTTKDSEERGGRHARPANSRTDSQDAENTPRRSPSGQAHWGKSQKSSFISDYPGRGA